jgi:hypothetical protein
VLDLGHEEAKACLAAGLGFCGNTSTRLVEQLRENVEATRAVELEEAERNEVLCDSLSDRQRVSVHTLCGLEHN